ncbi:MAG TPA: hypothetical protein VKE98_16030, partial [Gemmataceae bacterium]|nr:hypothetical protein [Gemmataceae bacterium]
VSERFPKGGALTIGAVGAVGMLSAGLIGTPAIGFQQDHFASTKLKEKSEATFERYVAETPKHFLFFQTQGLNGTKVGLLGLQDKVLTNTKEAINNEEDLKTLRSAFFRRPLERLKTDHEQAAKDALVELDKTLTNLRESRNTDQQRIAAWWEETKRYAPEDAGPIRDAGLFGGRMALKWTAIVPATMAILYLFLIIYFALQGGYKRVIIEEDQAMEKAMETPGSAEA